MPLGGGRFLFIFYYLSLAAFSFFIFTGTGFAQTKLLPTGASGWNQPNPFGTRKAFIENVGQVEDSLFIRSKNNQVLFTYDGLEGPVLFTRTGIVFIQQQPLKSEEEREALISQNKEPETVNYYEGSKRVYLNFKNAAANSEVSFEQPLTHYFSFGNFKKTAKAFEKIRYPEVYPGIDILFSFLKNQQEAGFEMSFELKPGADLNQLQLQFSGDIARISVESNGDLLLKNVLSQLHISRPKAYYGTLLNPEKAIPIRFQLNQQLLRFKTPEIINPKRSWVIDPFISGTGSLTGPNAGKATDIDYDFAGNIYVSGGGDGSNHKLAKYNAAGVLEWTFSGTLLSPVWGFGPYYGGWVVEKPTGMVYVGQGFISNGYQIIRLNPAGIYDNYITTPNPVFREDWKMYWNCNNGTPQIIIAGGGTNSDINLGYLDPSSAVISASSITDVPYNGSSGWAQDIADIAIDPKNNEMYTIFASLIGTPSINNKIYKHAPPYSPATILWSGMSGYTSLQEVDNRPYMSLALQDNGINSLAVNDDYFYYWDGKNLKAFNKVTGAAQGTALTLPSTELMSGGIIADQCNNIFIGYTNGQIKVYKFDGTSFNDGAAADISISGFGTASVYDLAYDEPRKLIYACGNGFVASVDISSYACTNNTFTLITTPDCSNRSVSCTVSPTPTGVYTLTYELYQGTNLISSNNSGNFSGLQQGITYTVKVYINQICSGAVTQGTFTIPGPSLLLTPVNATCGNTNGSITATGSGGASPYTYSLNGSAFQASGSFTGLSAGVYEVVVKDLTGCRTTDTIIIRNSNGPTLSHTFTDALCSINNGTITATASGGTSPYQYSIDGINFQAAPFFAALAPGTYVLQVKDATGCINYNTVTLNQTNAPQVTATPEMASCSLANGIIHLYGTGGTSPLTYNINGGTFQASSNFTGLTAGSYICTVKDAAGCNASVFVTIDNNPGPIPAIQIFDAGCGNANGYIQASATGGIPPLQYSLNGSVYQASGNFNGLAPGNYSLNVKDAGGCVSTQSFTIGTTPGPLATASSTLSTCVGNTGSITITATGGQAPYQYSLDGTSFQNNATFSGLSSGTYTAYVQDLRGCRAAVIVVVNQATAPALSATTVASGCNLSNGSITASVSGGTAPFQYSLNNGPLQSGTSFSGLNSGTYTLMVQDGNNCISTIDVVLTNTMGLSGSVQTVNTTCSNNNGVITVLATGNALPLQYSINGTVFQASPVFNNLAAGSYSVTIRDANGCKIVINTQIEADLAPSFTVNVTDASCSSNSGRLEILAAGGTGPYEYQLDAGIWQSSELFEHVGAGVHILSVRDAAGCIISESVTVLNTGTGSGPSNLTAQFKPAHCGNDEGKIVKIKTIGGTGPYQYSLNGGPYQVDTFFNNLTPGNYVLTVMDANGCTYYITGTIIDMPGATVTAITTPTPCSSSTGTIIATGHDGASPYLFSIDNGITWQSSGTFTGLSAGTYTIIIKDDEDCENSVSVTVFNTGGPSISTTQTDAHCGQPDGTIKVETSGGTGQVLVSFDNGPFDTQTEFTDLPGGTYLIIAQDEAGCTAAVTVTITDNPPPTMDITVENSHCGESNGKITITGTGTAPLAYSIDGTTFDAGGSFGGLAPGFYDVYIKDANNCYAVQTVEVQETPMPQATAFPIAAGCGLSNGGVMVTVSGGTTPYSFSSNGTTFQSSSLFSSLAAGSYTITVKDLTGCTVQTNVSVPNIAGPQVTVTATDASCGNSNAIIQATGSGGTTPYQFKLDGGVYQASGTFNGVGPGTHVITIKDQGGCLSTASIHVGFMAGPSDMNIQTVNSNCSQDNGYAIAFVNGGSGILQYSLDHLNYQPSNEFYNLAPGSYQLWVKDENNCELSSGFTVIDLPGPSISVNSTNPDCGKANGSIIATANGNNLPLLFSIDNLTFDSNNSFTGLTSGSYTVIVLDNAGCTNQVTVSLTDNAGPTFTTNIIHSTCNASNGSIAVSASGGSGPYQYAINGGLFVNTSIFSGLTAGNYTIEVQDANGCSRIGGPYTITTTQPAISTTNISICANQLPYSWNSNSYNAAGIYIVTLTAANGCDSVATLNLTVKSTASSTTNVSVCANQLPYSWNSNSFNAAGTYNVTLTAANGCDSVATLNLTVKSTATSTTNISVCANQLPYSWNSNSYNAAGTYNVTLTAANGCDSVATLNLTVKSTTTSTTNVSVCANQLPYSWNSNAYNAAGTYIVTLSAANGCDSVATLNLTVKSTTTSTTNVSVCANQLPYSWNSNSYNAAGTYIVTLSAANGCDSVATLNLTVKSTTTSTTNVSVCANQLPYSWNSNAYNAAGTYIVTLTAANGCDSVATLNLTVKSTTTSTTNVSVCANLLPYSWNSNAYNAAGTYIVTLSAANGCDSVATLNLTVKSTTTSTTNVSVCANQLPYSWNSNSYNAAGTYIVTLSAANGCDSVATLNLTVKSTASSTTNISICANQLPYSWNSNSYNAAGTYNVTLTAANGCDSVATLNLTVKSTASSTTNVSVCANQLPYSWNSNSYNAAGTYNVTLSAANGCDSVATLNLTINPTSSSSTSLTVCPAQLPYSWNGNSYNAAGTYTVTLTNAAGCDSLATLVLTVGVVSTSTTNISVCSNQLPYNWNGNNYNTAGTYTANFIAVSGCDSVATLNLTVNPTTTSTTNISVCANQLPFSWNSNSYNAAGTYTVTLTASNGCDSVATLNLTVNPISSSSTSLTVCPAQLPYSWNGNSYNAEGTYTVTLTNAAGCDSLATLVLTVGAVSTSTTNISVCANQLPYNWNGNNYNTAGTYTANFIAVSGCDSVATLNLTVNPTTTSTTNISVCANQLPFSWNSNSYNAAGTYTVTLTASNGCDSVATLNLTVNPISSSSTSLTVCPAQLPYSWNGNSYNAAGTYTVTLTNAAGCDSLATLVLTVGVVSTSTTNISVCSNQLPYNWNGNNYNTAGTYTANFIAVSGCDSVATLNLTVNPISSSSTNLTVCPAQLPYSWNGNNYNTAGTYNATLTNAAGCDSIATLVLTVGAVSTSTTNVSICSNQLPYNWNGNNYNTAGTYTANFIAVSGCDSVATLNLTVNPISSSSTSLTVCPAQLPYSWNGNSYNAAGTYTITLINAAGCDSIATLVLTVGAVSTSTTNVSICSNQLPYNWNGNNYNTAGSYTANFVAVSGCDSVATLNLTVNPTTTSTTNISVCANQLPYSWNSNAYNVAGTYIVTLSAANGCDSVATLNLTVNPTSSSSTSLTVCPAQLPYSWNGNSYNAAGTYTITLTNAAGCDSLATLVLTVGAVSTSTTNISVCSNQLPYNWNGNNYNTAGTYTANFIAVSGCDSVATLNLTINPTSSSSTSLSVCPAQLPYSWNGNSYNAAGTYTITLTNAAGCDSIATLVLTVGAVSTSTTNISVCSNQLPYNWNGNNYNTAGTYTANFIAVSGCDSVATLNLTVNPTTTSTTNISVCANQLPFSWNSNSYNAAGTYNVTLTASNGCDSVATLNLTVNPISSSSTNLTVCPAQLPYSWNGNSYNAAGTYTVTLTNAAGCDSIATLVLTVGAVSTSTTNVSICSNQLPYNWNGNNYNTAGTYTANFIAVSGCDSVATLNLTVNPISSSSTNLTVCPAQLPYSWNGNSYNAAGTYNVTLTASNGCDSVATLNLTVNPTSSSSTNLTVCPAQIPYSWNGNSYNTAGTYTVTLTNATGCDSIAMLVLTVGAVSTSTTNVSVCANQLPYNWNGNNYNTAGSYTANFIAVSGCDSVAKLNLTVKSTATSTTNISVCANQLPYSWNSNAYNAAGTYNVTLTASNGCDSVATLNLTVKSTAASTTNISVCANQLPFSWNSNSYNAAGTYNVTLTASNGCDSVATLILTIPPAATSLTTQRICTSQLPFIWNGLPITASGTYSKTLIAANGCDSIATLQLQVDPSASSTTIADICPNQLPYLWNGNYYSVPGNFLITLTAANGCDSVARLNLNVHQPPTSVTQVLVCINSLPYFWNGQAYPSPGVFHVSLTSYTGCDSIAYLAIRTKPVSYGSQTVQVCSNTYMLPGGNIVTQSGTYTSNIPNAAGCDSIITTYLTLSPPPVLRITQPASVCAPSTVDLTIPAVTFGSSAFSSIGYFRNELATDTLSDPQHCSTGTYYIRIVNEAGCSEIKPVYVTVIPTPILTVSNDTTICLGQTARISAALNLASGSIQTFSWTPAEGLSQPNGRQNIVRPDTTTTYTVEAKAINTSCTFTLSGQVTVRTLSHPVVKTVEDFNTVAGVPFQLHASGALNYSWVPNWAFSNSSGSDVTAIIHSDTRFIVTGTNEAGCKGTDTVYVKTFIREGYFVPNAFTPDGDGRNDVFYAIPVGIVSTEFFRVYNRYGELVFETSNLHHGWDGTHKGLRQNPGNFVWILKGKGQSGKDYLLKGNVILVR